MRHGCVIPFATEREFVELAGLAESSGWDAVFSWEAVWGQDAWATLAAAAVLTSRVRLGTLLTPASRHRPWDLASRVGTVDRLSAGRVTMCVGLGALHGNWLAFEADEGRAARARKLDESLAVYAGLMAGQPFSFTGEHYSAAPVTELVPPAPVQRPHPPVWVVGALHLDRSAQASLDRAARWEGLLPAVVDPAYRPITIPETRRAIDHVMTRRAEWGLPTESYDVILEGDTFGGHRSPDGTPADWEAAGATWWVESWWDLPDAPESVAELRRRIAGGPHR
ncbi:MAG: LLM class flavin-dependent oxidoreductase [Actinomycetales bacterium]|nr:LLM class flavin-dependent oxidoreductase [Actinomycetales bacterium]